MSRKEVVAQQENEVVVNAALEGKTMYDLDDLSIINSAKTRTFIKNFKGESDRRLASDWKFCGAINDLLSGKELSKDFSSDSQFAEFIGMSRTAVNKMRNSYKLRQELESAVNVNHTLDLSFWTISKFSELLTLADGETSHSLLIALLSEGILTPIMTQKEIRETVKKYKPAIETTEAEETEPTEAEETEPTEAEKTEPTEAEKTKCMLMYYDEYGDETVIDELTDEQCGAIEQLIGMWKA